MKRNFLFAVVLTFFVSIDRNTSGSCDDFTIFLQINLYEFCRQQRDCFA